MIRWIIGLALIALGFSVLFDINIFRFVIPILLIWLGWSLISKDKTTNNTVPSDTKAAELTSDGLNEVYVFSGATKKVKSTNFNGGKIVAVFASADFDLMAVKTKEKTIRMELEGVFGAVRLRIPKNWEVDSVGMNTSFGGFNNHTDTSTKKDVKLILSGAAVLGSVAVVS